MNISITEIPALISGMSALFAGLLWWDNKKLMKNAQITTYKQLRAYLTYENIEISEIEKKNSPNLEGWRVQVSFKNGGNTPAVNIIGMTNCFISSEKLPDNFDYTDMPSRVPQKCSMGARDVLWIPYIDIPIDVIESLKEGTQYVYIWGWADYDDVISGSTRHRTEFCVQMLYEKGHLGFPSFGDFNGIDESCFRKPS